MNKSELEKEIKKLRNLLAVRKYRKKNPEKILESNRKHYKKDPKKRMKSSTDWWKKNKHKPYYRLRTLEYAKSQRKRDRERKLLEYTGRKNYPKRCEICNGGGRIFLDHCHYKGYFRGWLCLGCNFAIGHAKDSAKILRKLADYLDKPPKKKAVIKNRKKSWKPKGEQK